MGILKDRPLVLARWISETRLPRENEIVTKTFDEDETRVLVWLAYLLENDVYVYIYMEILIYSQL